VPVEDITTESLARSEHRYWVDTGSHLLHFRFCEGDAQVLHFSQGEYMPAKNPRVNVVLEKPLYDSVRRLAAKEEISVSLKIRDLVKDALEAQEDIVLTEVAEEREKTFRRSRGLSHKQVWGS